jgi:hypothetical protein
LIRLCPGPVSTSAMRFFFVKCYPAALAAIFLCLPPAQAADVPLLSAVDSAAPVIDAQAGFEALAALSGEAKAMAGERLMVLEVDLGNSPGFSVERIDGAVEVRYRMSFNNIAEGWNWYPQADPQKEDYYHAKFLPLKSVTVERGEYDQQDKIGETQRMKVSWRYDYFAAFENLYDFYPRTVDDDSGFVVVLPASAAGQKQPTVRMLAVLRLRDPLVAESTTFWKATHANPTDFTLKKRYLVGQLVEVWFLDAAGGGVLAKVKPRTAP